MGVDSVNVVTSTEMKMSEVKFSFVDILLIDKQERKTNAFLLFLPFDISRGLVD